MRRSKVKPSQAVLDKMLGEASWLISHAEALADYGRHDEAAAELARAAACEEQVASWLDVAERDQEAVLHRVSAASCYEKLGQYARAVTLLRAALSTSVAVEYRRKIEEQLSRCLIRASREMHRAPLPKTRRPVAVVV